MQCTDPRTLFGILDAATDLIAISNASQRLIYVNPAGRAMVGWPSDADVTSRSTADLIIGDATATLTLGEGVPIAIRTGQWTGECRISGVGGRVIDVTL